ncbi:MAG TPA: helix-turn-helix domain-containing protein [Steroidobacteraceae bacterium]|nr:helix-turn-helix domain-containing protein [Steroidobacteraceae bacterium]
MDIGEVAKEAGLPVSALRYYEEQGLIRSIGRRGLRRLFEQAVLERLAIIALGRNAGFSLVEIGVMFTPGGLKVDRKGLSNKADELDKKIKQLTTIRDGLRHAAECKAPSHLECPKFQRLMAVAGAVQKRSRKKKK